MKRNLLLLALLAFVTVPAYSAVAVDEVTDAEYMINSGYSELTAEETFTLKNRATGKPIEPLYNKKSNGLVKFYKSVFGYIDPSIDSADRIHHDIQASPSFKDL
jgi:hypothetical protein